MYTFFWKYKSLLKYFAAFKIVLMFTSRLKVGLCSIQFTTVGQITNESKNVWLNVVCELKEHSFVTSLNLKILLLFTTNWIFKMQIA